VYIYNNGIIQWGKNLALTIQNWGFHGDFMGFKGVNHGEYW